MPKKSKYPYWKDWKVFTFNGRVFYDSGIRSQEKCPTCHTLALVTHAKNQAGKNYHFWECPTCKDILAEVAYDCPQCEGEAPTCPKCQELYPVIPEAWQVLQQPLVMNSLSRRDNDTYICNNCGVLESLADMAGVSDKTMASKNKSYRG